VRVQPVVPGARVHRAISSSGIVPNAVTDNSMVGCARGWWRARVRVGRASGTSTPRTSLKGFDGRTTIGRAVATSVWAALAFLLGSAVPILISVIVPGSWRVEYTALAVAAALAITSVILAKLGHTSIWQTLLRSVFIGLAAIGTSYLVGAALL